MTCFGFVFGIRTLSRVFGILSKKLYSNEMEGYIPRDDPRFPTRLTDVKPRIKGIWLRGPSELTESYPLVAIVGTRQMSRYGKQVLADIVPKLVAMGYVTVSGFMYGIDIEMHRLTIEARGRTIAVLGWGIDYPVVTENMSLYHKFLDSSSLFVSELQPNQSGARWTFPRRNRIVVGLADIVIVVEAGLASGSLNSADWARQMNKPLYAVPGNIYSTVSAGCNTLIAEGLALPFGDDFFNQHLYSPDNRIHQSKLTVNQEESTLLTLLRISGPLSINELSRRLHEPAGTISSILIQLSISGTVTHTHGLWQVA
jgi:DNA processing protein